LVISRSAHRSSTEEVFMQALPRVRPAISFLAGVGAIALLFAGVAQASPGAGRAASIWTIQPTPNRSQDFNQLSAVTANSATDAWAVGTFRGPSSSAFKTLIEHFDGTSWRAVQSPNVGTSNNELNGVAADSSTDAWAVGFEFAGSADRTLVERWNGTKWSVVTSPNVGSGSNDLRGVAAISPTDVWAVGQSVDINPSTLAEHWNGTAWTVVPTPTPLGGGTFTSVAAVSSNDVWALGALGDGDNGTLAEHWDGISWSIVAAPAILGDALFNGATALSSSDVWAVGSQGSQTLTEHWNGTAWSIVSSPNPLPNSKGNDFLTGVTALSSNDVWAVGSTLDFTLGGLEQTVTIHWDGAAWTVASSPDKGTGSNLLLGVDSPGGGVVFAAGTFRKGFAGTNRTLVLETTQG
jgi:hypothetical protein